MLDSIDDVGQDFLLKLTASACEHGTNQDKADWFLDVFARRVYQQPETLETYNNVLGLVNDLKPDQDVKNWLFTRYKNGSSRLYCLWAETWRKQDRKQMVGILAIHELEEPTATETTHELYSNGDAENLLN